MFDRLYGFKRATSDGNVNESNNFLDDYGYSSICNIINREEAKTSNEIYKNVFRQAPPKRKITDMTLLKIKQRIKGQKMVFYTCEQYC